jgi:hypothetical protein
MVCCLIKCRTSNCTLRPAHAVCDVFQTEVRERVVDVCCAGYAPDSTETQCLPLCGGCLHGVCATPDTCSCEPGYIGHRCDTGKVARHVACRADVCATVMNT